MLWYSGEWYRAIMALLLVFIMIIRTTSSLLFDYLQMIVFYIGILSRQRIVKCCKKTWIPWYIGKQIGKWNSMLPNVTQWVWQGTLQIKTLEEVQSAKYLGIRITNNLDWGQHILEITANATRTLGFLLWNLAFAPRQTKDVAYKILVGLN